MISNYEFIKAQSFEVSWAIFRCTELFSQSDLRKKVESAAVDLIADYDVIGDDMASEFPRIEKLVALVRLAESVGQITPINANVLYRELDNLAKATRLEIIERRDKKNIAVSLENIFTNSAYGNNLQQTTDNQQRNADTVSFSSVIPAKAGIQSATTPADSSAIQFGNIESLLSAATQSSQPISVPVIPALRQAQDKTPAGIQSVHNSAIADKDNILSQFIPAPSVIPIRQQAERGLQSESGKADSSATPSTASLGMTPKSAFEISASRPSPSAGSWQHVILQKVKDLNQTTTKELTASFPEISERTIRFYLQKLVDGGLIDRIGSTGPGAAYRAKV